MWVDWNILQKVFFCIAVPGSVLLIIQTILTFIGFGADHDFDFSPDDNGAADGLFAFMIRGVIAFTTLGGWTGFGLATTDWYPAVIVIVAIAMGILGFIGMAVLIRFILKLQSTGNIETSNSIGKTGKVYLPIPPKKSGNGKIMITVQEQLIEISAITDEETKIMTDELIKVVSLIDENTVLVARA